MARRIVRSLIQFAIVLVTCIIIISFLDRNFHKVLPHAIHEYIPLHHNDLVVTDIDIVRCSSINVFASCKAKEEDGWRRIDKDLYLGKGWVTSAYVHVRQVAEEKLQSHEKMVVDVAVGRLHPDAHAQTDKPSGKRSEGKKAGESDDAKETASWEAREGGIWLKRSSKPSTIDSPRTVTGVDVLFGDDAVEARPGWEIIGATPLLVHTKRKIPSAHLTVRRGTTPADPVTKPVLRIRDNGRFKILQTSDLHLSTGVGVCRDAVPPVLEGESSCEADPRTLDFFARILDDEKPDLVVLGGDQVNGETAPDPQSAIFKYARLLIDRKIPYVSIFGNHDDGDGILSRAQQMDIIQELPYSLSVPGPDDVEGVGNYYVEVLARGRSDHSALTIYLFDTHSYARNKTYEPGYDWVSEGQIHWFRRTMANLKGRHKEYTHVHMDISFIHIPLPEYIPLDMDLVKGEWREFVTAPLYNSGLHDAFVREGVVMVSSGHDHANDYCTLSMVNEDGTVVDLPKKKKNGEQKDATEEADEAPPLKPGLWMCYAGGAGLGGYAGYGDVVRRMRVFEVDANEARIRTWQRMEAGTPEDLALRVNEFIIVDAGRPAVPPPVVRPDGERKPKPFQIKTDEQKIPVRRE